MFLIIKADKFNEEWVGYKITDKTNQLLHFGIVRYRNLTALEGVDLSAMQGEVYLTVLDRDINRMALADRLLPEFQHRVMDRVRSWSHGNKKYGKPVICLETGETWGSVKACAEATQTSYSQLSNQLKGMVGYKAVKGKIYQFVQ